MCAFSTNIHYDYEGHYSKDEDEWIPTNSRLYVISFKTLSLEDISYSLLKERICRKMGIYSFTKRLNFGYISLVVEPKRQSYILDDEDAFVYLTSVDREQRRSILHVEDIEELQIVQLTEQQSRVGESSCSTNYCERERGSGYGEEENVGTGLEHNEHPHKKQKKSRL